ncbi:MAG: nitrogenase component 1 [Rubrobacteraceae bacterium]
MTILNESGVPDVLSPLYAVGALAERLPNTLVVVVGTRLETYLSRTLPADLSPGGEVQANPRVLSVVLDSEEPPEQGRLASRLAEAAAGISGIESLLVVAGHSMELFGLDAEFEAHLASRRLGVPAMVVSPDANSPGCLCTDLEDRVLAALVNACQRYTPRPPTDTEPSKRGGFLGSISRRGRGRPVEDPGTPVVLVGAPSFGAGDGLAGDLKRAGIEVAGRVPGPGVADLPPVGEGTVVALSDPYLSSAADIAEKRDARVVRTLMPIGMDGTARFIQDVSEALGRESEELARSQEMWQRLERLRSRIRGKRVFFAGDTGVEIPLARFLVNAGAVVLEVGAPRLDRKALGPEIQALGADVDVIESPDWRGQMKRIEETRPDLVITSPGLYVPLVARGHLCRSSLDILRAGIHGYEGARRILELFVRTFERADHLDSVSL